MKVSIATIAMASAAAAFCSAPSVLSFAPSATTPRSTLSTQRNMFSGAGESAPKEDNPEEAKKMEEMAAAMGMSVQEYQLGISARVRMETQLTELRITGGDESKGVTVERDGITPAKHLVVTVTDDGKALGKEELGKELVAALKSSGEEAAKARAKAQQEMMTYIGEEMKKMG
mmetsp:Transcript_14075/g.28373  ORF Transcript_14075/g.28373 Transcript_14075/m.28373 type:complete len:173 (+) Transcript_14075:102-620(+)